MSRINVVDPYELYDIHLVAEYRELPRIFGIAYRAEQRGLSPATYRIPEEFCLGKGHVKFFCNKLNYLKKRFIKIQEEMKRRGFNLTFTSLEGLAMPTNPEWFNDYEPTEEALKLSRERIRQKICENPKIYVKKGSDYTTS